MTIEIRVLSGLSNEGAYAGAGISHFLEHLLFKGTKTKTADEVRRSVKNMGGMINASTGRDSAAYHVTVPNENFTEALKLLFEVVTEAVFTDKEMETERDVILNEMKLHNDDPVSLRMRLLFEEAYLRHVYKYPIIGYEESFKKLSRSDILAYHDAVYTPRRMVIGIAGGVPPEAALKAAEDTLGEYRRVSSWQTEIFEEPPRTQETIKKIPAEVTLGYLAIGFHMTSVYSPDLYAGDVLNILLAGGNGSRLYSRLVKEKKLLYSVNGYNFTPEFPGLFIITGITSPEKLDEAREEIFSVIRDVREEGVTLEEIKRAKNLVLSGYLHAHEKPGNIASSMTNSQILMGRADFLEKYTGGIKKVTREEVDDALRKYLKKDNSTTVFLIPEELFSGDETILPDEAETERQEDARKIEIRPREKNIQKIEKSLRQEIAEINVQGKDTQVRTQEIPKKEVTRLDNGLTIIVREKGKLPLVSVTFAAPGGLRAETPATSGLSNFAASLVLKGTSERNVDEIIPKIEETGGNIASWSGMNSIGVSMDILSKDIDAGMDIYEDVLKNAVFREEEILKQKEKITAFILAQDNDIFENGLINLRKLLYGDHPYAMREAGEKETVNAFSRDEIVAFYKKHFVPDGAVITVVGDVDVHKVMMTMKKRFASWQGAKIPFADKAVSLPREPLKKDITMNKEQSLFVTGFIGVKKTDTRKYASDVISGILSGVDGVLFDVLRKEKGLSYVTGAVSVPEVDKGYFVLYAALAEKDLKEAGRIVADVIKKLKAGEISNKDISSSKKRLISQWAYAIETNHAVSMIMALGELYGLGAESYKEYPAKINAVSREDIINCAQEIFNQKRSATVLIHSK
ncbi:MAG: insulinase family protein [Candidatus Omnitrophica bacterium]|nr:insulinase family protein [Candidatus Omnitrophota bacterium]